MKRKGSTIVNVENRQDELAKVIVDFRAEGKPITRSSLIKEMKKRGYKLDIATLYRDRTALNQRNNYIRNFLPNYSAYQESINEVLEYVQEQAITNYERTWQTKKVTKTKRETKDGTFETVETSMTTEEAGPKASFLNILLKTQELKQKHANGENIQIAAVVIQSELNELRDKCNKLQENPPMLESKNE